MKRNLMDFGVLSTAWPMVSRSVCFIDGDDPVDPPVIDPPAAADPADPPVADPVDPVDPAVVVADPEAVDQVEDKNAPDWRDKRIAKLTARLAVAEGKKAADPTPVDPARVTDDPTVFEQRVAAEVDARTRLADFNKGCNDAAAAGRAAFPDFDQKIGQLTRLVDPADRASGEAYNTFLEAALETGEAPKLIHALGSDLNEASRILALPPVKMAVELARLASAKPTNALSAAPAPITAVGGRGTTHEAIDPTDPTRADRLSTREWMARMDARDAAKAKN